MKNESKKGPFLQVIRYRHTQSSTSYERGWQFKTVPGPKRLEQGNQKKPVVCKNSR